MRNTRARTRRRARQGTRRLRRQHGGVEIDVRQILMTQPILNAALAINPAINVAGFKLQKGEQGFPLSRMNRMLTANMNALLEAEPVELKKATSASGKPMGVKIDEVLRPAYEIVNGRHRIARAILTGRATVNATIV